ncbi:MAG: TolC family protein [Thermoanaerobaculia bacterium]
MNRRPGLSLLAAAFFAAHAARPEAARLSLDEAEALALRQNPAVSAARLLADAAAELPKQARSAYQPQLSGNLTTVDASDGSRIGAGGLTNPILYDHTGGGLGASLLLTDFGRTPHLVAAASRRAESGLHVAEEVRAQIRLEVRRAYAGVLRAEAVLKVAEDTMAARQLVADQIGALANAKLRSDLDVGFAQVNLTEAKLLLEGARNDVTAARAELANVVGSSSASDAELVDLPAPDPLPSAESTFVTQAIGQRPDLLAARADAESARQVQKAEAALFFPTLSAAATVGRVWDGTPTLKPSWAAGGVNLSLPLWNGGLTIARHREAQLRAEAAAETVRDLAARITRDVQVAYLDATTAYQRLGLTDELVQQAKRAFDLSKSRYDLGLGSIVELSQAELALTSAALSAARARYDYLTQRAVLDYAAGAFR